MSNYIKKWVLSQNQMNGKNCHYVLNITHLYWIHLNQLNLNEQPKWPLTDQNNRAKMRTAFVVCFVLAPILHPTNGSKILYQVLKCSTCYVYPINFLIIRHFGLTLSLSAIVHRRVYQEQKNYLPYH